MFPSMAIQVRGIHLSSTKSKTKDGDLLWDLTKILVLTFNYIRK